MHRGTASSNAGGLLAIIGAILVSIAIGCRGTPEPATNHPSPSLRIPIDRDDIEIRSDCTLVPTDRFIADLGDDGVVRIVGSDIDVVIDGTLRGSDPTTLPNRRRGIGIVVLGDRVRLRGGAVHGFRIGVEARGDQIVLEDLDLSHQHAQRLRSTPQRENTADWLNPYENDRGEWAGRYGAGARLVDVDSPTLRRIRVRGSQNGILLERVTAATVTDCDCSFLSGWGLAMWRTNDSVVSRNAFDFCIRGYSHEVYNRGHDSAGILLFEQCQRNLVVENSVTHGGDGIFGFAGREALGQVPPPTQSSGTNAVPDTWHAGRGNTANVFIGNDLSHAAAHGFEMTFSREWRLEANRLRDNGICGVWAGYSSLAVIRGNEFADNGGMAFGTEGGGVNIEHGVGNRIDRNTFVRDTEGIELWWDRDSVFTATPWGKVNDLRSADNEIVDNRFIDCGTAIDLRGSSDTRVWRNLVRGGEVGVKVEASPDLDLRGNRFECREPVRGTNLLRNGRPTGPAALTSIAPATPRVPGRTRPVGARGALAGRDRIVMTEWGPYDWESPLLRREPSLSNRHVWSLLGPSTVASVSVLEGDVVAVVDESLERVIVRPRSPSGLVPYRIRVTPLRGPAIEAEDHLLRTRWFVQAFPTSADPREDEGTWLQDRDRGDLAWTIDELDLPYGMGGPLDLALPASKVRSRIRPGKDRFGTVATTRIRLPHGRYRLRTLSDDGIRVRIDDQAVLENWTWHEPSEDVVEFTIDRDREVSIEVEHFELDGYSVLKVDIEPIAP